MAEITPLTRPHPRDNDERLRVSGQVLEEAVVHEMQHGSEDIRGNFWEDTATRPTFSQVRFEHAAEDRPSAVQDSLVYMTFCAAAPSEDTNTKSPPTLGLYMKRFMFYRGNGRY
ncbi:hypothetical protein RvY_11762 [Ramazzottius varieornatus]|uniref:Uncharacterized protein n=1 Tax=Ramazzottius varieornatus TaxID=947166 RepID=A0A1D1VLH6_RAMVA|nr:hypothetical protein RvY_11762 [Ramazzottius varieornatus]